jgi:hypothetical protein
MTTVAQIKDDWRLLVKKVVNILKSVKRKAFLDQVSVILVLSYEGLSSEDLERKKLQLSKFYLSELKLQSPYIHT